MPPEPRDASPALSENGPLGPLFAGGPAPGLYLARGPRAMPAWFLSAFVPALAGGGTVFWLDAGNCFDAHGASYSSRRAELDPRRILSRVSLARPFNLFQLETMVLKKLPALWRGEPIVVSDPMPLFYDEDVPAAEARRVLERVRAGMEALPAAWLLLAVEHPAPAGRERWLEDWTRGARARARLRRRGEDSRLEAEV